MNRLQAAIYNQIIERCRYMESEEIVKVMSAVIGWVSNRDMEIKNNAERKRKEDSLSGLEMAHGAKTDS